MNSDATKTDWVLGDEWFARADVYDGGRLVSPGRDRMERENLVKLDADIAEGLRGAGGNWRRRANAVLREWLQARKAS